MLIRKPLFLMAEGDGTGAGEGAPDGGGSTGGSGAGKPGGGDDGGKSGDEGKTFTQADVERIIAGRLQKYADYDDLRKQVDDMRAANQTEQERAVEAAKNEARADALAEAAPRLVAAEFRAALAGRRTAAEVAELIEDLDLSKYLTKAGEVDAERVTKKADLLAPAGEERKPAPSFGGGVRKTDAPEPPPGVGRLSAAYAERSRK